MPITSGATPSYVIWNLVHRYTKPGAVVVDPMCGSGTTIDVCKDLDRRGLGFDTALTIRSGPPAARRSNNYCLPFGRYRGRRVDSVPISYLQSIYGSDEYYSDTKLLQAVSDLYPNGLYESDAESFTLESGGFKGKRLDEVPKSYVWGLLR